MRTEIGTMGILALMMGAACDGGVATPGRVCPESASGDCFQSCELDGDCASGLYCIAGSCAAECDPAGARCPVGSICMEGRCQATPGSPERELAETPARDPGVCADVTIQTRKTTPNVLLVVDQSGSMDETFARGQSRWDVMRDALLDDAGLITELEEEARFGLALFSAASGGAASGMCPLVELVEPAINNFAAIRDVYAVAEPIEETPTGDSIDYLLDWLESSPDPSSDPTIFILATDGNPDTCAQPNPQEGHMESLAAVERAYRRGIRTFAISVGEGLVSAEHLQDVANAGVGRRPEETDAPYWEAGDDAGLRGALREIVDGALSCVIELDGRIDPATACSGRVLLNGLPVSCDDPNGWEPIDPSHIELRGTSCTTLQEAPGVTLEAVFPCNVVLI